MNEGEWLALPMHNGTMGLFCPPARRGPLIHIKRRGPRLYKSKRNIGSGSARPFAGRYKCVC